MVKRFVGGVLQAPLKTRRCFCRVAYDLTVTYYYGLLNALRNTKQDEKYSAEDVLKLTKNIYRVDTGDGQGIKVSAIQKKTRELLDSLGVNLLRKN